jgi:hypothetical protein
MKHLVWDKFRRLISTWIVLGLAGLIFGAEAPELHSAPFKSWWLIYMWSLSPGVTELGRGYGRVLLTLPFTIRQAGRFLWFVAVVMPTLVIACSSALGILMRVPWLPSTAGLFTLWLQIVLMGGLLFGSTFCIFSSPPSFSQDPSRRTAQQVYGVIFLIGILAFGYWLYKSPVSSQIKYLVTCLPGVAFTILGWHRAEHLLVDYGEYRQIAPVVKKNSGTPTQESGFGGIPFLAATSVGRQLVVVTVIVVITSVVLVHDRDQLVTSMMLYMSLLIFAFSSIGEMTRLLSHLKYLRTLALTSRQLAALFLSLTLLPFLILSIITASAMSLLLGVVAGLSCLKVCILGLAPVCVMITAAVWNSENRGSRIILAAIALAISLIAPVYQAAASGTGLPILFIVAYPIVFLVLALVIISHLIESNDMTYRMRALDTKDFN